MKCFSAACAAGVSMELSYESIAGQLPAARPGDFRGPGDRRPPRQRRQSLCHEERPERGYDDELLGAGRPADGHAMWKSRSGRGALPASAGLSVDRIEGPALQEIRPAGDFQRQQRRAQCSWPVKAPWRRRRSKFFVYRIVREIGSLTAALGGLDALVSRRASARTLRSSADTSARGSHGWVSRSTRTPTSAKYVHFPHGTDAVGVGDSDRRGSCDCRAHAGCRPPGEQVSHCMLRSCPEHRQDSWREKRLCPGFYH